MRTPKCLRCGESLRRHCDQDEPGLDHPRGCDKMHHEFRPASSEAGSMPEQPVTAHDHGNCELCDQIEAALLVCQQEKIAVQAALETVSEETIKLAQELAATQQAIRQLMEEMRTDTPYSRSYWADRVAALLSHVVTAINEDVVRPARVGISEEGQ